MSLLKTNYCAARHFDLFLDGAINMTMLHNIDSLPCIIDPLTDVARISTLQRGSSAHLCDCMSAELRDTGKPLIQRNAARRIQTRANRQ